jgi:hypothetical protein
MTDIPEAYDQWAPAEARWTPWVKPVLFYPKFWNAGFSAPIQPLATVTCDGIPSADGSWAIVIDAPGVEGIAIGLSLARMGYRPIPLYNGVPSNQSPLINVNPIISGLDMGGRELASLQLAPEAPPVFLLDSQRLQGNPREMTFDNRWVVTPQDFPSANRLRHHGITHILVVCAESVAQDLAAPLKRWQDGGLTLYKQGLGERSALQIPKPPRFRWLMERMAVMWGLRRSSAGGFGSYIPEPSKSSG